MPGQESFISFNIWTALLILLNTIIIYVVAKRFLYEPIMKVIKARQDEIDSIYADADQAKASAQALESEYQQKLSVAVQTSERIVKDAVARGQSREEEILRQAQDEAAAILNKAASDAQQEKKKALNEAKDEISGMAMAIAEKVVGRALTGVDQNNLVDEFIDQLGEAL